MLTFALIKRFLPLILGGIALLAILLALNTCHGARQKAAQAQNDSKVSTATQETAKDAAATVIERSGKDATLDQLVTETQKEIANATDSKVSRATAANAICGMFDSNSQPTGC